MPDKLTDKEIIKALEDMVDCNADNMKICNGCTLDKYYPYCEKVSFELALDLINRLQAENERLKDLYEKSAYEREMFLNELSQEADNFNIVRQLTVINCIEGDVLFQMTGKLSITADTSDNQLEIIVEDNGTYVKHFIGLSDNVTYVVEDLNLGANDVKKYKYTLNFNPNMWIPVNVETID